MRKKQSKSIIQGVKHNKVVWLLTLSDISTWGSYYIISVIAGIYLANKLGQNAVEIIGYGTTIYFISRAVFQIPVGIITDKLKKDSDEVLLLALGSILMGTSFIFYPFITTPVTYFFLQFLFGLGTAMNLNTWRKLFATNISQNREGREYGMYEVLMSLSIAGFSSLAGIVANEGGVYFDMVIVSAGLFMMTSFIWALLILRIKSRKSAK
ncbi:MAG: MFS transporter [Candidatus Dojkabacteria bacterium]|uniref:Major Facilitator Superfamily protein n=2 Tax=Candidatus Dojkabacteria TaxID=74243 RepID=A0A136KFW1_9BACT|nr:MAG: Major Facilitator Superfamily protein [candidate division WS6 bacterium OLB21]MBW7953388.1 MFS transporter [Candidatus Dojkabacteria bacterium]WKZ27593.1 MAG: MFS transporter [Candidatus Dojkabacteria bacterium]